LQAIGPGCPESLAEELLQRVAAGADVPVEIVYAIGHMMAADDCPEE
jgi:hypothetical protein